MTQLALQSVLECTLLLQIERSRFLQHTESVESEQLVRYQDSFVHRNELIGFFPLLASESYKSILDCRCGLITSAARQNVDRVYQAKLLRCKLRGLMRNHGPD